MSLEIAIRVSKIYHRPISAITKCFFFFFFWWYDICLGLRVAIIFVSSIVHQSLDTPEWGGWADPGDSDTNKTNLSHPPHSWGSLSTFDTKVNMRIFHRQYYSIRSWQIPMMYKYISSDSSELSILPPLGYHIDWCITGSKHEILSCINGEYIYTYYPFIKLIIRI